MDQKKDPGVVKLVKHMPPEILSKFQRLLVTFKIQIPNDRIQPIREAEDMEEFLLIGPRTRGNWNSNPQPTSRKLHGRSCGTYLTCVSSRFVEESLQGCCAPGSACGRYCECSPDMIGIIPVSTPSLVDPFQVPFILDLLLLNVYFFYDLFFTNGKSVLLWIWNTNFCDRFLICIATWIVISEEMRRNPHSFRFLFEF